MMLSAIMRWVLKQGDDHTYYLFVQQLDGFWRRYNKAQLDKLALEAEKRSLEKENQTLRSVLKQYLDGVSVNNETLKVKCNSDLNMT